jgi:hypothetical protein
MNEHKLAERFSRDVDRILQGAEAETREAGPVSEEYNKAVDLAKTLAETDFSDECRERPALGRRLLDLIASHGSKGTGKIRNLSAELGDEELDNVAGGTEKERQTSCVLCNCRRSARTITGDTCPDCGHPRECHPM